MPLVNRTFDQLINFTRTTAATFVGSNGLIQSTPQSRNLLTFTEEFDNAAWTKSNVTIIPNQNPAAATLGSELVTNGDFSSGSTGWTVSAGWAVGTDAVATATSTSLWQLTPGAVAGRVYAISFDVVSYTSGTLAVTINRNYTTNAALTGAQMSVGRKTVYVVAGTDSARGIEFYGGTVSATIDNVSVRELVGGALQAPDGTNTADTAIATASASVALNQSAVVNATAATFSIYAKQGNSATAANTFRLRNSTTSTTLVEITLNYSTGAIAYTVGSTGASAVNVGNGWWRIAITATSGITSGNTLRVDAGFTGTAATNDFCFLWGAQLEQVPDANLVLGGEVVANGDFSGGATGWTTGAGWAIGSGVATATATNASLLSGSAVTAGKTYRVAFDVTSYTAGTLSVRVGTGAAQTVTSAGSRVLYLTAVNTAGVEFYGGGITLSLDNVSVREITGTTGMPSDYTRNFGGLFPPRFDYDPVTLAPRGLLIEEQRTNLLLRSEEFDNASWSKLRATVTANSTTSPDGTANAEKLVEDTSTDTHLILQAPTVVASTTYSYSVFLKAAERTRARLQDGGGSSAIGNFDLSNGTVISASNATATITNVGDGWYRCTITFTTVVAQTTASCRILLIDTGTNTSYTGDGTSGIFLWGAQLEAGAFATSYIPTVASQVTRTADVATIAAPNFASWYNQTEGTFVAGFDSANPSSRYAVSATDGTSNNFIAIDFSSGGQIRGRVTTGGVSQASLGAGAAVAANAVINAGIAYRENSVIAAAAGTLSSEDTSVTLPAVNQLSLGALNAALLLNGHIRSIRYYPTRLSNAQLQALTA